MGSQALAHQPAPQVGHGADDGVDGPDTGQPAQLVDADPSTRGCVLWHVAGRGAVAAGERIGGVSDVGNLGHGASSLQTGISGSV